jgi:uncharacterized protein
MRIIRFTDLQQSPWKNGGGITREIAILHAADTLIWRLSIADVGVDGPFSRFEGMNRILTVVEGHGMALISPHATLHADYAVPVSFDGALDIQSRLNDGPLRDVNLIYNPSLCSGHVQAIPASSTQAIEAKPGRTTALYCVAGSVQLGETEVLHKGDTALIPGSALHFHVAERSVALVITIQTSANN